MNEVANVWRNATDNELQPWQPAEPPDDGRRVRCFRAPCHRFPLESSRNQMGLLCPVASKLVMVTAEARGSRLTQGKEGISGLPHHKKLARSGPVKGLVDLSTMFNGSTHASETERADTWCRKRRHHRSSGMYRQPVSSGNVNDARKKASRLSPSFQIFCTIASSRGL